MRTTKKNKIFLLALVLITLGGVSILAAQDFTSPEASSPALFENQVKPWRAGVDFAYKPEESSGLFLIGDYTFRNVPFLELSPGIRLMVPIISGPVGVEYDIYRADHMTVFGLQAFLRLGVRVDVLDWASLSVGLTPGTGGYIGFFDDAPPVASKKLKGGFGQYLRLSFRGGPDMIISAEPVMGDLLYGCLSFGWRF